MRKTLVALAATPFLVAALASCSSSSSTGTSTPAESTMPSAMESAVGGSASEKVDAYCAKVQEFVQKANEAKSNPTGPAAQELLTKSQELSTQAQEIIGEVTDNPELAQQVQQCSQEASTALSN